MVLEQRTFLQLLAYASLGFIFYYAIAFFGVLGTSIPLKILAVTFFIVTIPLPSALMNSKHLFPELTKRTKRALSFAALLLILHHFMLSFVVVLLMPANGAG